MQAVLHRRASVRELVEPRGTILKQGVALVVLLHFFAILAMAALPQWHVAAHADAEDSHHQCAVTLITGGGLDVAPAVVFFSAPQVFFVAPVVPDRGIRMESQHLSRSVLEHGPPACRVG